MQQRLHTRQQHMLVATRRWAKRSGMADATGRAYEPFRDTFAGPIMDVRSSVGLYIHVVCRVSCVVCHLELWIVSA